MEERGERGYFSFDGGIMKRRKNILVNRDPLAEADVVEFVSRYNGAEVVKG